MNKAFYVYIHESGGDSNQCTLDIVADEVSCSVCCIDISKIRIKKNGECHNEQLEADLNLNELIQACLRRPSSKQRHNESVVSEWLATHPKPN